mmetsp:Transcript_33794/g.74419  ORF Transcript_33794/g.74419 Transcript_33794/m.74419 type:complete len:233 (-) Transcript_33794:191-889(-)
MDFPAPVEPSAYGFRSIRPRTRLERRSLTDKVSLEKNRINQRVGWQARMHRQNAPETSALLTSCTSGAAGYLSNSDRFHTDTVGEEYALRQEGIQRKLLAADFRRNQSTKRDADRWHSMEDKQAEQEEVWQKQRDDGSKAKKNQSNVAYDIMTLQYSQDKDGEHQKYLDDMVRYRASQRTNMLIVKGDTRVRYNIISGDDRPPLQIPDPIDRPGGQMSARVDRRLSTNPIYN